MKKRTSKSSTLSAGLQKQLSKLETERADLTRRLTWIQQRIAAIHLLLEDEPGVLGGDGSPAGRAEEPFRDRIKRVLASHKRSMSPKAVADAIEIEGTPTGRRGKLMVNVSTELYRLAHSKSSGVERIGRGKYILRNKETETAGAA